MYRDLWMVNAFSGFPTSEALASRGFAAAWAMDGGVETVLTRLSSPQSARMPRPDEVLIWLAGPAEDAVLRAVAPSLIEPKLQASIGALRDVRDRKQALTTHVALQIALNLALGVPPRALALERSACGKPHLPGSGGLHFSLSHTRGAGGFALARWPVGFDIEQLRCLPDMLDVAEVAFAPETQAVIASLPPAERTATFYRFWTLGEAYIKVTGLGVSQGLQSFAFAPDGSPRLLRATPGWGPPDRWRFGVL